MTTKRRGYPSDVSDEEWAFCCPYLTLMKEDAPQREYPLRELFSEGAFQRPALDGSSGLSVEDDAHQHAALACRPSTGATLDKGWML